MDPRISIITLGVENLQRSLSFYKDGLGWKTSKVSNELIAFFPLNVIVLALYPKQALADDIKVSSAGSSFSGITLAYNVKSTEEVDEVLRTVEEFGAKIMKQAEKVFWGGYSGYFADPDGHLWEVAYNPYFDFDENNNIILP
ncbi:MAG: VOC family protein [Firmicutes bacterium]|nr:VOC family protein [Bacillota bacterium]